MIYIEGIYCFLIKNDYIINQWHEKVNIKFLYQLILIRLIKGCAYFVTEKIDKRNCGVKNYRME